LSNYRSLKKSLFFYEHYQMVMILKENTP